MNLNLDYQTASQTIKVSGSDELFTNAIKYHVFFDKLKKGPFFTRSEIGVPRETKEAHFVFTDMNGSKILEKSIKIPQKNNHRASKKPRSGFDLPEPPSEIEPVGYGVEYWLSDRSWDREQIFERVFDFGPQVSFETVLKEKSGFEVQLTLAYLNAGQGRYPLFHPQDGEMIENATHEDVVEFGKAINQLDSIFVRSHYFLYLQTLNGLPSPETFVIAKTDNFRIPARPEVFVAVGRLAPTTVILPQGKGLIKVHLTNNTPFPVTVLCSTQDSLQSQDGTLCLKSFERVLLVHRMNRWFLF